MRREGDELEPTLSVPPTRHLPSSRPSVTVRASFSSSEAATSRITFASTRETTASAAAAPAAASFALEEGAAAAFAAATRGGGCVSSVEGFAAMSSTRSARSPCIFRRCTSVLAASVGVTSHSAVGIVAAMVAPTTKHASLAVSMDRGCSAGREHAVEICNLAPSEVLVLEQRRARVRARLGVRARLL